MANADSRILAFELRDQTLGVQVEELGSRVVEEIERHDPRFIRLAALAPTQRQRSRAARRQGVSEKSAT